MLRELHVNIWLPTTARWAIYSTTKQRMGGQATRRMKMKGSPLIVLLHTATVMRNSPVRLVGVGVRRVARPFAAVLVSPTPLCAFHSMRRPCRHGLPSAPVRIPRQPSGVGRSQPSRNSKSSASSCQTVWCCCFRKIIRRHRSQSTPLCAQGRAMKMTSRQGLPRSSAR